MLKLAHVLEALTGNQREASLVISEAAVDSRQVIPGSLFIALPGERADGGVTGGHAGLALLDPRGADTADGRLVFSKGP